MLTFNPSQLRLANKINKQKRASTIQIDGDISGNEKRNANENSSNKKKRLKEKNTDIESIDGMGVSLSSEMIELMESTLSQNIDGYLDESVSSVLTQPLSMISLFNPAAALLESEYTSSRIPIKDSLFSSSSYKNNDSRFPQATNESPNPNINFTSPVKFSTGKSTTSLNEDGKLHIDDAKSRLNILWLRRRAELARESGNYDEAVSFLDDAIVEHLGVEGSKDYLKADLSKPVLSSDPRELLETVQNTFFLYDKTAHSYASRIQRWYLKRYKKSSFNATILSRVYRGHLCRKRFRKWKEKRRQCAILIQRRFRIHLVRMHRLATKIKQWFKLRKEVKAFQRRLHLHRMAIRIQKFFRGYLGRKKAWLMRKKLMSAKLIQHNIRGHVIRRDRAFPIALYHKMYFIAARKIQKVVRKRIAIHRCQVRLLVELTRENNRFKMERLVVEETLRLEKLRHLNFIKTDSGKVNYLYVRRAMKVKDALSRISPPYKKPENEFVPQTIIDIIEKYDEEGNGCISSMRLKKLLKNLCIPTNKEFLKYLIDKLDIEKSGYINLTRLLDWYSSEDADSHIEPLTIEKNFQKSWLEIKQGVKQIIKKSSEIFLTSNRFSKAMFQQRATWLSKDIISTYRLSHPPKFQCCQCLTPFVMFTDYFLHFNSKGMCGVLNQKALFYSKYWIKQDWDRQRQCEYEIIRVNDEFRYIKNISTTTLYTDFALNKYSNIQKEIINNNIIHAQEIYKGKFAEGNISDLKKTLITLILEIVSIVDLTGSNNSGGNNSSDNKATNISLFILDTLVEIFSIPMKEKWVSNNMASISELKRWLNGKITVVAGKKNEETFSDESENVSMGDVFEQLGPKRYSTYHINKYFLNDGLLSPISEKGRLKLAIKKLGMLFVQSTRLMQVFLQSSLWALMEFRSRRPRRTNISDEELISMELYSLTEQSFEEVKTKLMKGISTIEENIKSLHVIEVSKQSFSLRQLISFNNKKINPQLKIKEVDLNEVYSQEVQVRADTELQSRIKYKIGKNTLKRLSNELWHSHKNIVEKISQDININSDIKEIIIKGNFNYHKFSNPLLKEDIDIDDIDLVLQDFSISPLTDNKKKVVIDQLDPEEKDYISLPYLLKWLNNKNHESLVSNYQFFLQFLRKSNYLWQFKYHAHPSYLSQIRKLRRLQLSVMEDLKNINQTDEAILLKIINYCYNEFNHNNNNLDSWEEKWKLLVHDINNNSNSNNGKNNVNKVIFKNWMKQNLLLIDVLERHEWRVIYDEVEKKSENIFWYNIFSINSFIFLFAEMQLIGHLNDMMKVVKMFPKDIITNENESRFFSEVSMLLHYFDVDCSGKMDETKVKFAFKAIGSDGSSRALLGLTDLKDQKPTTLANLLASKTTEKTMSWWSRKSSFRLAILQTIVTRRIFAKRQGQRFYFLSDRGQVMIRHDIHDKYNMGLLIRSQLLATRQLVSFLKTSHGRIQLSRVKILVQTSWESDIVHFTEHEEEFDFMNCLKYAFYLHFERSGMLVTELPYLVKFLLKRMKFIFNSQLQTTINDIMNSLYNNLSENLRFIQFSEVTNILSPLLVEKDITAPKRRITYDSRWKMGSCARQQAVLIAMNFQHISVPETNYRCSILGLHCVLKQSKLSSFSYNSQLVPREVVPLFLLAQGFTMKDLHHESLAAILKVDPDGDLCMDFVDIENIVQIANLNLLSSISLTPNNTWSSYWNRIIKIPFLSMKTLQQKLSNKIRYIFVQYEYNKMCRIFTQGSINKATVPTSVKQMGAEFLQEIILGRSRSAMEST